MAGGKTLFGVDPNALARVRSSAAQATFAPNTVSTPDVPPAAAVNPEPPTVAPPTTPGGYAASTGDPRRDVQIAASMLQRNADGSLTDPTESQMAALLNTYRLPDGTVVDARTANALKQATARGPSGGGYYQKHFNSATEDYLKNDPQHFANLNQQQGLRKDQYESVLRVGEAGREQAYQDLAATDAYQSVIRAQEQQQMAAQMEADKRYKAYEKDLHAAQRDYDVALGGGTSGSKAVRGAGMLFGGLAAALAQAYGASAQIRSGGVYKNQADVGSYMNGLIEQDMFNVDRAAQGAKQRMTQVQAMYQDFRQKFKDDTVAREATKAVAKEIFAAQVEKNAQQFKGTQVWENAQQQAAEIRHSAAQDRENANLLMRQVIDQNTHLLQAPVMPGTPGIQLESSMDALLKEVEARGKLRAALAPYGSGGKGEGLSEGGKGRVQKATEESAGYATAGRMADELASPGSPLDRTDRVLRGLAAQPSDQDGILDKAGNAVSRGLGTVYGKLTGQDLADADAVAYREQAALQPLRVAITGAGAGMQELNMLSQLISAPGSNEQKKQRYQEAVAFTARFIAQKAPPDPAERQAYIENLRRNGAPPAIIQAVETGQVRDPRQTTQDKKRLFGQ